MLREGSGGEKVHGKFGRSSTKCPIFECVNEGYYRYSGCGSG